MNQSDVVKRIKEICDEFDSRVAQVGLAIARLELAKALAEAEAAQPAPVADLCPNCGNPWLETETILPDGRLGCSCGHLPIHTGFSAWEDLDFVVTIRPDFEKSWKSAPIGGVLDKDDARRVAEWLQGALPELWKIFTNVAAQRAVAGDAKTARA